MNEPDSANLPAALNTAIDQVCESSWKARLAKFAMKVAGVLVSPDGMRKIADEMDTVTGRGIVSRRMAEAVADRLAADPDEVARAVTRFYGTEIERQRNLEAIILQSADHVTLLTDQSASGDQPNAGKDQPSNEDISDDWRARFVNYAQDVSDQEMRNVWARMLAGEIINPGSFSYRTMRLVSEISPEVAQVFQELSVWALRRTSLVLFPEEHNSGEGLQQVSLLREWDIIRERPGSVRHTVSKLEGGSYLIRGKDVGGVIYAPNGPDKLGYSVCELTSTGRELLRLLPENDERPVVRKVLKDLLVSTPLDEQCFAFLGAIEVQGSGVVNVAWEEFLLGNETLVDAAQAHFKSPSSAQT